jgi:4-deoxy-L-threo-5-hexosulose-uronate ketol-isomerase
LFLSWPDMKESEVGGPAIHLSPRPQDVERMNTAELRESFLIRDLHREGELRLRFTDLDRLAVGGAVPVAGSVRLENHRETGRDFFLERRELGAINTGGPGTVCVDGRVWEVEPEGCIYIGMGAREVTFGSQDGGRPARFFMLSCPAHAAYPTATATARDANTIPLGSAGAANQRVIRQFIHEKGIRSCQLVMGFTALAEGSVWNTFPPHTHNRRSEVYFYFDLGDRVLAHFVGRPGGTRHVFVQNEEAVLSPPWSIHCGCGQGNYKFIWGMAGENQRFDDMDGVRVQELR